MSRIDTIHIENRRKIKNIILKFPELMESNAKEVIEKEYYNILSKEDKLQALRHEVWNMEEEIKKLKKEFNIKSNLFDLEFETSTKEIQTSNCTVAIQGCANTKY